MSTSTDTPVGLDRLSVFIIYYRRASDSLIGSEPQLLGCIHQRGSHEAKIWKHLVVFTTTRGDSWGGGGGYIFQYILPCKNRRLVAIRLEVAILLE